MSGVSYLFLSLEWDINASQPDRARASEVSSKYQENRYPRLPILVTVTTCNNLVPILSSRVRHPM